MAPASSVPGPSVALLASGTVLWIVAEIAVGGPRSVGLALVVLAAATTVHATRARPGARDAELVYRWGTIAVVAHLVLLVARVVRVVLYARPPNVVSWLMFTSLVVLAVVAMVVVRAERTRYPRATAGMVIAAAALLGLGWVLATSAGGDVWVFQTEAAERLAHGSNPYRLGYPDPYPPELSRQFYAPGLSVDGQLQVGFPYPPLSLLLTTAGHALGDIRLAHLAAWLTAGGLMLWLVPGSSRSRLAGVLMLTNPTMFLVLEEGWTEPLVVVGLAAAVFALVRRRGAGVWAGLLVAVKQYGLLFLPLLLTVDQPRRPVHARWRSAAAALGVAAAVTVPFLLWDVDDFFYSVGLWQFDQPFRADAMSFLVPLVEATSWSPGAWMVLPTLLGTGLAMGYVLWRGRRTVVGRVAGCVLVMLGFVMFSKQAFVNYYAVAIGAAYLGLAGGDATGAMRPSRQASTSGDVVAD